MNNDNKELNDITKDINNKLKDAARLVDEVVKIKDTLTEEDKIKLKTISSKFDKMEDTLREATHVLRKHEEKK